MLCAETSSQTNKQRATFSFTARRMCIAWCKSVRSSLYKLLLKLEGTQRVHISAKWICNTIMTNEWSLCWPMPWRYRCTVCCGKSILRNISVIFLYISPKPPLLSWTLLYLQKDNKTMFLTLSCRYRNSVNFSHTSRIHFSANNTSFCHSNQWDWMLTDSHTDTQKWKQYILGGYNNEAVVKIHNTLSALGSNEQIRFK